MIMLDLQHTRIRLIMMVAVTNLGMIIARNVNAIESVRGGQKVEMTIEEAHEILCKGLVNAPSEHEWCIAFRIAIDTMRKYQKIEQIVQACGADYNSMDSYDCVEEIARIIVHGNDD